MSVDLQGILNFLGTPGGQTLSSFAGAGLKAYGDAQNNQANRQQGASQFAASTLQNQYNTDQSNQTNRAAGVLNADPLGASQNFAQKNAMMAAILPQMRNAHSTPGDAAVAGAMGTRSGGLSNLIPQGGFDPQMIQQNYGPETTMNSIVQRQNELSSLNPNTSQPNITSMFGNTPSSQNGQATIQNWAQQLQSKQGADRAAYEKQLNGYINQMQQQESDTGGFWHTLGKIASVVGAGVATIMTAGGASPLLAGAIGAGSGMLGAASSDGNPLMGAIMGGGMQLAGGALQGMTGTPNNGIDLRVNH